MSQGRGGGAKEEGGYVDIRMVALDDQRACPCDMGSEVPKHLKSSCRIQVCLNVNLRWLGPFEVHECTVNPAGLNLKLSPEGWTGC